MKLLHLVGFVRGGFEENVAECVHPCRTAAGETDRRKAKGAGHREGTQNIPCISTRANCEQQVTGPSVHVHLLGKDHLATRVVVDGGGESGMTGERDGRYTTLELVDQFGAVRVRANVGGVEARGIVGGYPARKDKSFDEFPDNVLAVRGTAAVAANKDLASGTMAGADCLNRANNLRHQRCQEGTTSEEFVDLSEGSGMNHGRHGKREK